MTPLDAGLAALASPIRRDILDLLATERTPGEVASFFAVSRSDVSQHLRILLDAKLVSYRRQATRRWYVADADALKVLVEMLADEVLS